jgi:hypothetical protein
MAVAEYLGINDIANKIFLLRVSSISRAYFAACATAQFVARWYMKETQGHLPVSPFLKTLRLFRLLIPIPLIILLIPPQSALILRPRTQVPSLNQHILRSIDVVFRIDFFHADAQAVFGEDYVLGFELGGGLCGYLLEGEEEVVADEGEECDDDEEEDEGEEFAGWMSVV